MKIEIYNDGIGSVEYVQHMGEDITVVNSARVSFGKQKDNVDAKDKKLINEREILIEKYKYGQAGSHGRTSTA